MPICPPLVLSQRDEAAVVPIKDGPQQWACSCQPIRRPFCDADGKTYGNHCQLRCAHAIRFVIEKELNQKG
jgi:hypothetical protein